MLARERDGMIGWLAKSVRERDLPYKICVGLVVCAVFVAFCIGVKRDFPTKIGAGNWGRMVFAIGAAITEMEHGGYGYVTAEYMDHILTFGGLTANPDILKNLGLNMPDNFRNPAIINDAIRKAVAFKWNFNPHDVDGVRGAYNDDVGFIDYVKFSFQLFGYNVASFYFTDYICHCLCFFFPETTSADCNPRSFVVRTHCSLFV